MSIYFLLEKHFDKMLSKLMKKYLVIAPQLFGDVIEYSTLKKVEDLNMGFIRTKNGIKRFLFPQIETVYEIAGIEDKYSVKTVKSDQQQKIIFGARSCDAHAIYQQSMVFNHEFSDSLFENRNRNAFLIVMNCIKPGEYCFCTSMGTGPFAKERYDLELTPIINGYLVESSTEKGATLLQELDQFLAVASINQQKEKETQYKETITRFSRHYDIFKINRISERDFDSPKWEEVGASCIECGGCVYVCPTCTCFDLLDTRFIDSERIEQIRVWDTCLFSSFSRMAGGVNPRKTLGEKYRQRTLKKLNFTKSWYDCHHCVGCGRCIEVCPGDIGIDIGILAMINFSTHSQEERNRSQED